MTGPGDDDGYRAEPLEYAIYGVLAAAKLETGAQGARRLYRIQSRLDNWDDAAVGHALKSLIARGWARELPPVLGMIHYEAIL